MVSPRATLDVQVVQAHRPVAGPVVRSDAVCAEALRGEELRWTIASLSGVGLELAAAATMIEGDGRALVDRAIADLDEVMATLRNRYYGDLEGGGPP